ncbi:MAG: polyprenyl synthetase family protein [Clostridia bacterium]|nr:polyprenyl synthetase family protein [Clostridia bacterium]
MDYGILLEKYVNETNKYLEKVKTDKNVYQKTLFDAVNYSLMAEGKRLRPVLLLASCEAVGGNMEDALPFAAGLEMIHNSSLIHDDLPAMDNDDLRRGRPTNHKVYGEATAILAGDVLLVYPFEVMADGIKDEKGVRAMKLIAHHAGSEGMMGGQQIDLENEGREIDLDTVVALNSLKTGALFKAAAVGGAIVGGADEAVIKAFETYAENLGLAFQLVDDLLDNDPSADTGKTKGSDIANNKSTYLSKYGEEKCRQMVDECTKNAADALKILGDNGTFLVEFVQRLASRVR